MRKLVLLLVLIFFIYPVFSKTVVINSEDWRDVFIGVYYAKLKGWDVYFMHNEQDSQLYTKLIPKDEEIIIFESSRSPFIKNLEAIFKLNGFNNIKTIYSDHPYDFQIFLWQDIQTKNFIIIDDAYGYNSIPVSAFGLLTNSWILFVNKDNWPRIKDFLSKRKVNYLMIYGHIHKDIFNDLLIYNPDIIDYRDKYRDAIALADKFLNIKPTKQIIATTGTFIEKGLIGGEGKYPILFMGKTKLNDDFFNFLLRRKIKIVMIIGNELIPIGKELRDRSNKTIGVFVKFGQGFTIEEKVGKVYALTMFPIPYPNVNLTIERAIYDPGREQLFVIYKNTGDVAVYSFSDIDILADGTKVGSVSDENTLFIEKNEKTTGVYYIDLTPYLDKELTGAFTTMYGEFPNSLDNYLLEEGKLNPPYYVPIKIQKIQDNTNITVEKVVYNTNENSFYLTIKNLGKEDAYFDLTLLNLKIEGVPQNIELEGIEFIPAGEEKTVRIYKPLNEYDLERNQNITVLYRYGKDPDIIPNAKKKVFSLEVVRFGLPWWIILIIVLIVLLILILLFRRRREEEEEGYVFYLREEI